MRKGDKGSHVKRIITVREEPNLHVNSTRKRCPGLNADTLELPVDVVSKSFPLCEPIQEVEDCTSQMTQESLVQVKGE